MGQGGVIRFAVIILAAWMLAWPALAQAATSITDCRIERSGGEEILYLRLTGETPQRAFVLPGPYRIVIDLERADWQMRGPCAIQSALVKEVRHGYFKPTILRVVLDLAGPAKIEHVVWQPGSGGQGVLAIRYRSYGGGGASARAAPVRLPQQPLPSMAPPKDNFPIPEQKPRALAERLVVPVIAIDAGHGGTDPGAIGASGTQEKDLTLSYALALADHLERSGQYNVMLTRDHDIYIPLRERIALARAAGADLFLSLHADSGPDREARGVSIYTLSPEASDEEAEQLAARENKSDIIAGIDLTDQQPDVADILIDLAQRETGNRSAEFARLLIRHVGGRVRLLNNSHRFAGFAVLKSPDVPSVLIETGFISNPQEERLLKTNDHKTKLIKSIGEAIDTYFERHPKVRWNLSQ